MIGRTERQALGVERRSNLVAAHPQNLNAVRHGIYSARVLAPRAREVADQLMSLPHVRPLDALAADEIGSIVARLESIDRDLDSANTVLTGTVATSTSAAKSVTFKATDLAGNQTLKTCTYDIVSSNFLAPVNNAPTLNIAKLGRVVPVKANVYVDGSLVPSTTTAPIYVGGLSGVSCDASAATDPVEVYAAAGSSNTTNLFRWDGTEWIYNFDTSAFPMKVNNCYRINVYYGGTAVSGAGAGGALAGYIVMQVTK
jgi:hypothetical protein